MYRNKVRLQKTNNFLKVGFLFFILTEIKQNNKYKFGIDFIGITTKIIYT